MNTQTHKRVLTHSHKPWHVCKPQPRLLVQNPVLSFEPHIVRKIPPHIRRNILLAQAPAVVAAARVGATVDAATLLVVAVGKTVIGATVLAQAPAVVVAVAAAMDQSELSYWKRTKPEGTRMTSSPMLRWVETVLCSRP